MQLLISDSIGHVSLVMLRTKHTKPSRDSGRTYSLSAFNL